MSQNSEKIKRRPLFCFHHEGIYLNIHENYNDNSNL